MAHRKSSSVPAPACRCCHLGRDCAARCPAAGLLRLCTLQASPRRWWQGLPWLSAVPDRSAALSSPCRSLRRSAGTQVSCCMELASAEGGSPLCPPAGASSALQAGSRARGAASRHLHAPAHQDWRCDMQGIRLAAREDATTHHRHHAGKSCRPFRRSWGGASSGAMQVSSPMLHHAGSSITHTLTGCPAGQSVGGWGP